MEKTYAIIDLKSFFASVECVERGKDPFTHKLVVADTSRGTNAICLAVSSALRALGIPGRARIKEIPSSIEYEVAKPRMQLYMEKSAAVYEIYLKYISENDIHIYSIDECFLDYTDYLSFYKTDAIGLTNMIRNDIYKTLGLTATAGIAPNMFLAKVALDILAKHEKDGICTLDKKSFKEKIQCHEPITDIWRIGPGTASRLAKYNVKNLYDVCNLPEDILYKEFGKNALFLIDHAHGEESCTIKDIKSCAPKTMSLSNSQILFSDYKKNEALTVLKEMVDSLVLELVDLNLETAVISLFVKMSQHEKFGLENSSARTSRGLPGEHCAFVRVRTTSLASERGPRNSNDQIFQERANVNWEGKIDFKNSEIVHKSSKLDARTNSYMKLNKYFTKLYKEIVPENAKIRQLGIALMELSYEGTGQIDLFSLEEKNEKEKKIQKAVIEVKNRFGKNSLLRANSLKKEATGRERNKMIGGHSGENYGTKNDE